MALKNENVREIIRLHSNSCPVKSNKLDFALITVLFLFVILILGVAIWL